ncbi:MAG: 6-carboxytetrahydropterin synthase QueD [Spirochaetes bacterium GWF1_51_8]|nr:MAG: 6-carboxytetrahydropterin synthase QueD [Spirochaetes bacterium GWF1_51_8]
MSLFLTKDFKFDAAHSLENYHGKCENLHGHTYKLSVTVKARMLPENGMIVDFVELSKIVKDNIISKLDHSFINDTVKQSTAENIVMWIHGKLAEILTTEVYEFYEIKLWETETSYATWRKDDDALDGGR